MIYLRNYCEWVHLQARQLLSFRLPPFLMGGQLLKERICSLRGKFFPLAVDPILKGCFHAGKQAKSPKLFPLEKKDGKRRGIPIFLKSFHNVKRKDVISSVQQQRMRSVFVIFFCDIFVICMLLSWAGQMAA